MLNEDTLSKRILHSVTKKSHPCIQPILDNVTEAVTGSVADLAILINGDNLKLMRREADSILAIIKTI